MRLRRCGGRDPFLRWNLKVEDIISVKSKSECFRLLAIANIEHKQALLGRRKDESAISNNTLFSSLSLLAIFHLKKNVLFRFLI